MAPRMFFVASYLPHLMSIASSTILANLFENLPADDLLVMGYPGNRQSTASPPYHTHQLPALPSRGQRWWRFLLVPWNVWQGIRQAQAFQPDVIVATFPDDTTFLTGYLIHRFTSIPLAVYLSDLYLESNAWLRPLDRWLQSRAFRRAAAILCVNRGMADFYYERYGLQVSDVPVCINDLPSEPVGGASTGNERFTIGYSGTINRARIGGLNRLAAAIGNDPRFAIRLFSPTPRERLMETGLWRDTMTLEHFTNSRELVNALAECDAVFLPLTFKDFANRDQLVTCFGIKSYEYMVVGRPIIVQAPPDYFTARFYTDRDAGMVVGEPTVEGLRVALNRLWEDEALRARLGANAFKAATEFEGATVAKRFIQAVTRGIEA